MSRPACTVQSNVLEEFHIIDEEEEEEASSVALQVDKGDVAMRHLHAALVRHSTG